MMSRHLGQNAPTMALEATAPMTAAGTGEAMNPERSTNLSFLKAHDAPLVSLGLLADRYRADGPTTCLLELQQLTDPFAQLAASRVSTEA